MHKFTFFVFVFCSPPPPPIGCPIWFNSDFKGHEDFAAIRPGADHVEGWGGGVVGRPTMSTDHVDPPPLRNRISFCSCPCRTAPTYGPCQQVTWALDGSNPFPNCRTAGLIPDDQDCFAFHLVRGPCLDRYGVLDTRSGRCRPQFKEGRNPPLGQCGGQAGRQGGGGIFDPLWVLGG